jgi:hypothetical protein
VPLLRLPGVWDCLRLVCETALPNSSLFAELDVAARCVEERNTAERLEMTMTTLLSPLSNAESTDVRRCLNGKSFALSRPALDKDKAKLLVVSEKEHVRSDSIIEGGSVRGPP